MNDTCNNRNAFVEEIAEFHEFGIPTRVTIRNGIPYLENEFWTRRQRQGNSLHEISYRGCFKSELPEFFITRLTRAGDVVLDPFMGRGTTVLQAVLMERKAVGNDINPLGSMLLAPRINPPSIGQVENRLGQIDWESGKASHKELLAFFHPVTLAHMEALRTWLLAKQGNGTLDNPDSWIRMVAINRLTGHSSGFLSGYTLPPNQAVSIKAQLAINARLGLEPPQRDVAEIILKKTRSLLKSTPLDLCPVNQRCPVVLKTGYAADMNWLGNASIDLVVTSPPFLDVIDYAADNWLRCWFAGIDSTEIDISLHRGQEAWIAMVGNALGELARVVRPGGHVAFEVGEIRGGRVLLETLVWQAAERLEFDRLCVVVNQQDFTKTSSLWGVDNGAKGTNSNRIVVLRRR